MDPSWVALHLATPEMRSLLAVAPDRSFTITRAEVAESFHGYDLLASLSGTIKSWLGPIGVEIEFRSWSRTETELLLRPVGRAATISTDRYFTTAHLIADWVVELVSNPMVGWSCSLGVANQIDGNVERFAGRTMVNAN